MPLLLLGALAVPHFVHLDKLKAAYVCSLVR